MAITFGAVSPVPGGANGFWHITPLRANHVAVSAVLAKRESAVTGSLKCETEQQLIIPESVYLCLFKQLLQCQRHSLWPQRSELFNERCLDSRKLFRDEAKQAIAQLSVELGLIFIAIDGSGADLFRAPSQR